MFVSCQMDLIDFPGLQSFAFLVAAAQTEVEVYAGTDDEDSMQMGTIITSVEQRNQFRDAIQVLRQHYKSELSKYNDRFVSITKIFVQTKFPEDGNDGEWFDGVMLTITYRYASDLEFIEVHVKNHGQRECPRISTKK